MRHLFYIQTLLHLPSLLFLLLLAVAVFFLTLEETPPLPAVESEATDIVWSRHTNVGEIVRIRAPYIRQSQDGIIRVEQVEVTAQTKNDIHIQLHGIAGRTDSTYQKMLLSQASGELLGAEGSRMTLILDEALYYLDSSRLEGKNARLNQLNGRLNGDEFIWNGKDVMLRGNVVASFDVATNQEIL